MSVDLLQSKIRKRKCPLILRLAPSVQELPPHLLENAIKNKGTTLAAAALACKTYCTELIDSLADIVPGVCISAASFLALGHEGISVAEQVLAYARKKDLYTIFDLMNSYAPEQSQMLAESVFSGIQVKSEIHFPFEADCITVNGYHGSDSIRPWLPYCRAGKSLLLLIKSANKSGREVQELLSGDRVIYTAMADLAMRWSTGLFGANGYSQIGVICGTGNGVLSQLRRSYDRLFIFVDGIDAPSASVKHVSEAFDKFGHGAALFVGSTITSAWKKDLSDGSDYLTQAKNAAEKIKNDLMKYVVIL